MLKTTQQSVARWESGKATPSVSALRDLATIYSTSVDDILGKNPFSEKVVTNTYYILQNEDDGFWGHLGLLGPHRVKSTWYPITEGERQRLWRHLRSTEDTDWFVFTSLNNRIVAFRASMMKRVWLLDDACDEPKGDWDWKTHWDDYAGLPKEVYRAMSEWAWDQVGGLDEFEDNNSPTLRKIALKHINDAGLTEKPEEVLAVLHHTKIHLNDGTVFDYEADPDELWSTIQDLELEAHRMLYIPSDGGEFESFFPASELCWIDMPLIDVEKAAQRSIEELEQG